MVSHIAKLNGLDRVNVLGFQRVHKHGCQQKVEQARVTQACLQFTRPRDLPSLVQTRLPLHDAPAPQRNTLHVPQDSTSQVQPLLAAKLQCCSLLRPQQFACRGQVARPLVVKCDWSRRAHTIFEATVVVRQWLLWQESGHPNHPSPSQGLAQERCRQTARSPTAQQ